MGVGRDGGKYAYHGATSSYLTEPLDFQGYRCGVATDILSVTVLIVVVIQSPEQRTQNRSCMGFIFLTGSKGTRRGWQGRRWS